MTHNVHIRAHRSLGDLSPISVLQRGIAREGTIRYVDCLETKAWRPTSSLLIIIEAVLLKVSLALSSPILY